MKIVALLGSARKKGNTAAILDAFLITGGGRYENNADSVFTTLKRIRAFHKTKAAGEWFVDQCTTPEEMDPSLKTKAAAFARKMVA